MLALLSMSKVCRIVANTVAGANDTQADAHFVAKAMNSGREEVAASTAAVKRSSSGAIKRVARTIRADQRSASDQLGQIGRAKGLSLPADDPRGSEAGYSDAAFIEHEIKSHLEAIALYEDEARSSDAQLRAFAQSILPQLQRHLTLLRSLKSGK